ncbi:MAG: acyltransferase, partial [Paramuribaculum sp.]|nr:acyltransferase [Paramuribaculum sp.]
VAIGDNLLIYDWINNLVRLNKSFIVKRGIPRAQALDAARQLSAYIHYAITEKHESVWIAQREGRAKDSNDVTQESLVKMLGLEGGDALASNIMSLNVLPLSISYEYDPNDYLKAKEFLMKSKNPDHKKSEHDDLLSMETGILKSKGRVHLHCGKCITPMIADATDGMNRIDTVKTICHMIDCSIHAGYRIYPINYIAYEAVSGSTEFADKYTTAEKEQVYAYWEKQLDKLANEHFSADDRLFMLKKMQEMYANPLINQIKATTDCAID